MNLRTKRILLSIFAILFGISAGCIVAEILLRIATPEWLSKEMNELNLARNVESFGSTVGWSVERIGGRFVRFVPYSQFHVRYYEYDHHVHIDRWGGRVLAPGKKRKVDSHLIPFLGDSFPFGIGVRDEETFVSILNSQSSYNFLNLAVPGSALPNQLDQIEFRYKELHSPSVFIFNFFLGNDFMDIFRYHGKLNVESENQGASKKIPDWVIQWLNTHIYHNSFFGKSYLLQFVQRTVLRNYFYEEQQRKSILPTACVTTKKGNIPITSSVLLIMTGNKKCLTEIESYVKLTVKHLDELSRRLHFHPLFIVIPDRLQTNRALLKSKIARLGFNFQDIDVERPNKIIENELGVYGIPFIDVSECLNGREDAYYPIDGHFTVTGHRIVAEYLANRLDGKVASLLSAPK
jgi:hypothetical protein